jgi:hypothetical protein
VTSSSAFTVDVVRRPTTIVYTGDRTGDYHDPAKLTAILTDTLSGAPLAGKTVDFGLGTQTASHGTDGSGVASTTLVVDQAPGDVSVGAAFGGDESYLPSSDAANTFTITREETTLAYTGATVILADASDARVTARLVEDGANDDDGDGGSAAPSPSGQTITFAVGGGSCSGTADSSGTATCTIPSVSDSTLGPNTLTASFAGDSYYLGSSESEQVTLFAFPDGGAFVLGDTTAKTATLTTTVTWWGGSWWKLNNLSGTAAPPSFKGFADNVYTLPTQSPANGCGATFGTAPGNRPPPPTGDIPSYMGVLVASSLGKSGPYINGAWNRIVVVDTDPGYTASPGHPGTGTIVATFCP